MRVACQQLLLKYQLLHLFPERWVAGSAYSLWYKTQNCFGLMFPHFIHCLCCPMYTQSDSKKNYILSIRTILRTSSSRARTSASSFSRCLVSVCSLRVSSFCTALTPVAGALDFEFSFCNSATSSYVSVFSCYSRTLGTFVCSIASFLSRVTKPC